MNQSTKKEIEKQEKIKECRDYIETYDKYEVLFALMLKSESDVIKNIGLTGISLLSEEEDEKKRNNDILLRLENKMN